MPVYHCRPPGTIPVILRRWNPIDKPERHVTRQPVIADTIVNMVAFRC